MPTPPVEHRPVDRRRFLRSTGAAAALALPAASYAAVAGSNARLRVGFLGCGGRAQAHIHTVSKRPDTAPAAVCDVWDGLEDEYDQPTANGTVRRRYAQGLYPAARACGLDPADRSRVTKDYRRVLDRPDVDAVCISTPDHWHARMALDAVAAGKDVFVESPLAARPEDAVLVAEAAAGAGRVVTVGCQGLADPGWRAARDLVASGAIGPPVHLSAGVFRADPRGYWRFYRVVPQMTPATVDWDLFLGHRFAVNGEPVGPGPADAPFDPTLFAQWRCDGRFGGGPFLDLFAHPVARLLAVAGVGMPARVVGSGGLYAEADGRSIPDAATLTAEFRPAGRPGCHLVVTGSTAAAHAQPEVVCGPLGAVVVERGRVTARTGRRSDEVPTSPPPNETAALWADFVACVGRRDRATVSPADLGAATAAVVGLARRSLATGRAEELAAR